MSKSNKQPAEPADDQNQDNSEKTKALTPLQNTAGLVAKYASKLINDERAQKFYAGVMLLARQDPKIAMCTQDSILAAMMACVHLDLMPNTPEQLAFIIPYRNKKLNVMQAQFQVGYKGLVRLAYNSAGIASINAELVFPEDEFSVDYGMRTITHKPNLEIDRTNYSKAIAAYAVAIPMNGGQPIFDVMSRSEIEKVKKTVKAGSSDAPWQTWEEAMVKKTVLKRLTKVLPQSSKDNSLQYAAAYDNWAEAGKLAVKDGEVIEQAPQIASVDPDKVRADAAAVHANLAKNKTIEGNDPHAEVPKKGTKASIDKKVGTTPPADVEPFTLTKKETGAIEKLVDKIGLTQNGLMRYLKDTTGHLTFANIKTDRGWHDLQNRTQLIIDGQQTLPKEWLNAKE